MCKLQSVLLIATIVCSHSVNSSPTGRAKAISNGKSSTTKAALDPKPLESNVAAKAQEEHHLGLITDAAKDDFTENAAKQDEIGYLRSFHKKGNGGYDRYEAFHNKDNAEYEHEDREHIDKEDKKKKSHKDASNGHATETSSDDDYEDYDQDAAIDKQLKSILQEEQPKEQQKPTRALKGKHSKNQKKSVRTLSDSTQNNPEEIDQEKQTEVTTPTELDDSELPKIKFSERITENVIKPKSKPGYEVHETPEENEKNFKQKRPEYNRQFFQGTATNHGKPHKYNTKSAKRRPSGGGYEAFIVHDEEDENDFKEHDLRDKGRHSLINSHYPTSGINHNKKASKEKNYDEHADYNEAEEEAELSDEDENFPVVQEENLSPTGSISNDEGKNEQEDDEDEVEYSNDDIDYDDVTPHQQKNSNYEDYTNDRNEDYDYTDRKKDAEPTAFKQDEIPHENVPEYDYEYYDDGDAGGEKDKNIQTKPETYAKFSSRDKENDSDYDIAYDYGNEQVQQAEDEYD